MARRGLNCTLSYQAKGDVARVYRVRVKRLAWGFEMLADETQSRTEKAYYPRKTAPTQFALTLDVIGAAERTSLNTYLLAYAKFVLNPMRNADLLPQMTVTMPSRGFQREGVWLNGAEFGTMVGEMLHSPSLVFETSREPLDWNVETLSSTVQQDLAAFKSKETQYFYPTGVQLSGDQSEVVQAAVGVHDINIPDLS